MRPARGTRTKRSPSPSGWAVGLSKRPKHLPPSRVARRRPSREVRVPAGDSLTPAETERLARAVQNAERISGLTFSVYVGVSEEDSRAYAERLHNTLEDPPRSVLIMCNPGFRALEIVTGSQARRQLDDVECRLAAANMRTSFEA